MEKEICTIYLGKGQLDNDYTIYENGKVYHFYDRNPFKLNIEEWLTVNQLTDETKKLLLDKCPSNVYDTLKNVLYST